MQKKLLKIFNDKTAHEIWVKLTSKEESNVAIEKSVGSLIFQHQIKKKLKTIFWL